MDDNEFAALQSYSTIVEPFMDFLCDSLFNHNHSCCKSTHTSQIIPIL